MCDLEVIKKVFAYRQQGKYRLGDFTREELLSLVKCYADDAVVDHRLRDETGYYGELQELIAAPVVLDCITVLQSNANSSSDFVFLDSIKSKILNAYLPYLARLLSKCNKESEQW